MSRKIEKIMKLDALKTSNVVIQNGTPILIHLDAISSNYSINYPIGLKQHHCKLNEKLGFFRKSLMISCCF